MTSNTLLLRQVNPGWVQQGHVTSQVFKPTPKDEKRLSAYDGDKITAEQAWNHFTGTLGRTSIGVLAVSVSECQTHDLPVASDPAPFLEHVFIDFTGFERNDIEKKAKQLRAAAVARGWQYRAEGSS